MTELTSVRIPDPASLERLPRCCTSHADWPTLAQHLLDDFAEASISDVVRELNAAKRAIMEVGLSADEELAIAELIVRHQLMLLCGRVSDVARLDPERHVRAG